MVNFMFNVSFAWLLSHLGKLYLPPFYLELLLEIAAELLYLMLLATYTYKHSL